MADDGVPFRTYSQSFLASAAVQAAATAEAVPAADLATALRSLGREQVRGMVDDVVNPLNDGRGLLDWQAAWPNLVALSPPLGRAVLRYVVALARQVYPAKPAPVVDTV